MEAHKPVDEIRIGDEGAPSFGNAFASENKFIARESAKDFGEYTVKEIIDTSIIPEFRLSFWLFWIWSEAEAEAATNPMEPDMANPYLGLETTNKPTIYI